ncbi:RNA 2'-phosphotransferase [Acinetobacter nosocomialis]|uniref:Probable RNA 2'-phosphotransferase n=1 Tax=Acinetobacter nosocomialis TaxID=106654 RepID=A0A2L1VER4_ACINO|nr:RNA 2'-phosphotransferase [Acinetobacter nosocomialis]AVF43713.1 RNA--NAD 2'-phosphotransferase [Acinetobacter nosocomialis]MBP1500671.1 RNA 2'-phosphotransferase [Acinetobacter nosocomialis]MBR7686071.1 RNA 2'-phosphotransferase [Acinetobacter nosocomialis]MBR7700444.1 RNA 2'-phosphotransferase [Acinetobacter nosocomialis]MBR7759292.1 RNA 2'-phosphotransferase [Acinetobacter nosocomialis]
MKEKAISQYLSFILRHKPEEIDLTLDHEGWANIEELISKSQPIKNITLDEEIIKNIVSTSDKKRFQISDDGKFIRAVQGHSTTSVDITLNKLIPPTYLYHGTAQRFIDSIKEQGLISMDRQYVHLTENKDTALSVGTRYGKPEILIINALKMHNSGFNFFQAENGVWLVKHVPVDFITFQ